MNLKNLFASILTELESICRVSVAYQPWQLLLHRMQRPQFKQALVTSKLRSGDSYFVSYVLEFVPSQFENLVTKHLKIHVSIRF